MSTDNLSFQNCQDGCIVMDVCIGHLTNQDTGNVAHVVPAYMHLSGYGCYVDISDKPIVKYTVNVTSEYQQSVALPRHEHFDSGHRNIAVVNILAETAGALQHRAATYAVAVEVSEDLWLPNILVDVGYLIRPKVIF